MHVSPDVTPHALGPGTQIGPYRIEARLGEGGAGVVYRAFDTKLQRPVAIKFLFEDVADAEARRRFQREAQMASSLNHPHILTVYDVGEHEGRQYLVTEFVDGGTLRDWSHEGKRPTRQIVELLVGVADGLAEAHAAGILHRDIKPDNVLITKSGYAKLADFGLAKLEAADPEAKTVTLPATRPGLVVGTISYMSPEQAGGRAVDPRSDVFSFGVMLYELVVGRRPFTGATDLETLQTVIHGNPDPMPGDVPIDLRLIIEKALEKDPAERYQTMREFAVDLRRAARRKTSEIIVSEAASKGQRAAPLSRWVSRAAIACLAFVAVAAGWNWWAAATDRSPGPEVTRFEIRLAADQTFRGLGRSVVAVSPDGHSIVFNTTSGLYLRTLSDLQPRLLTDENVRVPVFSPDGQAVLYWSSDLLLKKIAVTGGQPVTVAAAGNPYGASWESDGTILHAQDDGIWRVPENGGTPIRIVEAASGEHMHGPQLLPGGTAILYSVTSTEGAMLWDQAQVVVHSLTSNMRTTLLTGGSDARYLPPGRLVYAVGSALFGVGLDLNALRVIGQPVPLINGVQRSLAPETDSAAAHYSISATGMLVYLPASVNPASSKELTVVSRRGIVQRVPAEVRNYRRPRASPDGTLIAVEVRDEKDVSGQIWVVARESGLGRQLTFEGSNNRFPVWTPDGRAILYLSSGTEVNGIYRRATDGSGSAEPVLLGDDIGVPIDVRAPGILTFLKTTGEGDIWSLRLGEGNVAQAILATSAKEDAVAISPDGRWLAYVSNESGPEEVYVRPYSPATGGQRRIGVVGAAPAWSPDGRELFFLTTPFGRMTAVAVDATSTFTWGRPQDVFEYGGVFQNRGSAPTRPYDVARDGSFITVRPVAELTHDGAPEAGRVIVVQNWQQELERLVPAE
jgi:serine/threonine-protein kinase